MIRAISRLPVAAFTRPAPVSSSSVRTIFFDVMESGGSATAPGRALKIRQKIEVVKSSDPVLRTFLFTGEGAEPWESHNSYKKFYNKMPASDFFWYCEKDLKLSPKQFAESLGGLSESRLVFDCILNTTESLLSSATKTSSIIYYLKVFQELLGDQRLKPDIYEIVYCRHPLHMVVLSYPEVLEGRPECERKTLIEAYWEFIVSATKTFQSLSEWEDKGLCRTGTTIWRNRDVFDDIVNGVVVDKDKHIRKIIKGIEDSLGTSLWDDPIPG